jgi:hypothetical protein
MRADHIGAVAAPSWTMYSSSGQPDRTVTSDQ